MVARDGYEDGLRDALVSLAGRVCALAGCEGAAIYRDVQNSQQFSFLERWTSLEDYKAGGARIGKDAFTDVITALSAPPVTSTLEELYSN